MSQRSSIITNTDSIILGSIYGYYVRYDRLNQLVAANFANSTAEVLDIFIDLPAIVNSAANRIKAPNTPPIINPLCIASGVINLCAHYREFFKRYYRTHTRFWILNCINLHSHKMVYPLYTRYPMLDHAGFDMLDLIYLN